jgi:hypothetical protein
MMLHCTDRPTDRPTDRHSLCLSNRCTNKTALASCVLPEQFNLLTRPPPGSVRIARQGRVIRRPEHVAAEHIMFVVLC